MLICPVYLLTYLLIYSLKLSLICLKKKMFLFSFSSLDFGMSSTPPTQISFQTIAYIIMKIIYIYIYICVCVCVYIYTHSKKIQDSVLCVCVYLKDITNTVFPVMHVNVGYLHICLLV